MKKLKGYKTGIDFEKKDVLFDPYIIGVWLGNSTLFKKTLDFLSKSNEIQLHNALITYNLLNVVSIKFILFKYRLYSA